MKRRRLGGLLLLATLVLGACSAEDKALAQAFIAQWAMDHADEIAMRKLGLSDGNSYVDAAVDAADVVMKFQQAEDLMAKGRKNSDPKAMDEALKLRPNDWTYELSRANLALQLGDVDRYWTFSNLSENDARGVPVIKQQTRAYAELVAVHNRLDRGPGNVTGYTSSDQCYTLYDSLLNLSDHLTGDQMNVSEGKMTAEQRNWVQRRTDCEKMPR